MNDRFGITPSVKLMLGSQPAVEILVVIDFAIKGDPYSSIFIGKRLLACAEINDAQPPMGEGYPVPI
jgi:hypothetical protein